MDRKRHEYRTASHPADPGIGGMLLLSLGFHLLIGYLFIGVLTPRFQRELRPVYYVDLINLPVAEPQAGRPDAAPEPVVEPPPSPRPEPPPPARKPQPKPETKPAPKPEPTPKAPPKAKPEPKPEAKPAPKISAAEEKALAEAMRRLQAKQERDELKRRLNQLADTRKAESTAKTPSAPVGEQTGKGSEIGISHQTWLGTHLKEEWRYSPYLAPDRLDLEAKFSLFFDASGKLVNYKVESGSGNEQFDQSIVRAILKLFKDQRLPNPPKEPSRLDVTFNLKELQR